MVLPSVCEHKIDAHASLDAKDVMACAGEFRVFAHVAAEVEHMNQVKVLFQFLSHPVEAFSVTKQTMPLSPIRSLA